MFVNSKSLSSLKIDDTPVDDPSLKVLVANNSDTLKLLKMSSCPHVSPAGLLQFLPDNVLVKCIDVFIKQRRVMIITVKVGSNDFLSTVYTFLNVIIQ